MRWLGVLRVPFLPLSPHTLAIQRHQKSIFWYVCTPLPERKQKTTKTTTRNYSFKHWLNDGLAAWLRTFRLIVRLLPMLCLRSIFTSSSIPHRAPQSGPACPPHKNKHHLTTLHMIRYGVPASFYLILLFFFVSRSCLLVLLLRTLP